MLRQVLPHPTHHTSPSMKPYCYFKRAAVLALLTCWSLYTGAAQPAPSPRSCELPGAEALDFWLGEWDLTWPGGQGGTPEGETGTGTNTITRVLDDCIIYEQFYSEGTGLEGRSWSAFNGQSGQWQQTWVDNGGSYLLFTGPPGAEPMELRSPPRQTPSGDTFVTRMTWNNVTEDSLDWNYQYSTDGGTTWIDSWNIHYTRRK